MSYHNRWRTKDDILKDLAEVTGRIGDVDDQFIINGEKPPPSRRFDDEDDEMDLRFRSHLRNGLDYNTPAPDLKGISQMLRMVNEHDERESELKVTPADQIVVSKLNPDVPEFVPLDPSSSPKNKLSGSKVVNSKEQVNCGNNGKYNLKPVEAKNTGIPPENGDFKDVNGMKLPFNDKVLNEKIQAKNNVGDIKMGQRLDVSALDADQIRDMTIKLKSKISDASERGSPQMKREKNVAIATLLKLYSATPRQATPKHETGNNDTKPVKLFTPEYFKSCPAGTDLNKAEVNLDDAPANTRSVSSTPITLNPPIITKPDLSPSSEMTSSDSPNETSKDSLIHKSTESDSEYTLKHHKYAADPYVQNSIKKVNNWFDKPKSPKPKGMAVCLGPISFKRKTVDGGSSKPPSSESSRSTPNSAAPHTAQYKPSQYAEDLSKKFMERGKALQKQHLDIWERAQIQMKEREELMNKKQSSSQETVDS